jgi:NCS2 family nucleobase:cation symporter-2
VNEKPGWGILFALGVQHIFILSIAFIFPVIIVDAIGGTADQARGLISMAMIATGITTILQALKGGPVGSGYLCPLVNGPAFLSASLLAGKTGGLSLIFGMTAVSGVFEAIFSRLVPKLRAVFPPEVTGTIVMMVGIDLIPTAVRRFAGVDSLHDMPNATAVIVGLITLFAMSGFIVWGKGRIRLYCVLMGLAVGYASAAAAGLFGAEELAQLSAAPFFTLPSFGSYGLSFDVVLLIPFLVATLSSALKTMGDLTMCQKINDADWKRPDMQSISRGMLACSVGNLLSGMLGALGQSVSSSNVSLSVATGAASRAVAYAIGAILICIAFLPKLSLVFVVMPGPVMGACLIFAASFMILAGIQIVMSRLLDARKTFVIGISMVFGLSVEFVGDLYANAHPFIKPFFLSSLSLATLSAVILNLFFRIGISKSARVTLVPGHDSSETVFAYFENQGARWGAPRDVIFRAASVINEFLEAATQLDLSGQPIEFRCSFDEFNMDIDFSYSGKAMIFPDTALSPDQLLDDQCSVLLSGFLIRRHVDSSKTSAAGGLNHIHFHFDV